MDTTHEPITPTCRDTAADYFDDLLAAARLAPELEQVYRRMNHAFRRCIDQFTADTRLNLSGNFAKTDYLLKERQAAPQLVRQTNDTRVRLSRQSHGRADFLLADYWRHDLRNVSLLVAFLFGEDVPHALCALFPADDAKPYRPRVGGESVRVIVERWDDELLYCQPEAAAQDRTVSVAYASGNTFYPFDWTYLRPLLRPGCQLNLVRPRQQDGVLYPELIVVEPDYLVDVSSVARCFTNYADSPLVHLLHKIEPQEASEATTLGNFVGQLLDETIHDLPDGHTYAESVETFFRSHAATLLATDISPEFHNNARRQKQHIERAMRHDLPAAVGGFDAKEGVVEPSFFSEMLGLQGRMDYLQLDFRVLLEQKSGKGAFPYDDFVRPRYTEEHYVQLLLYMALIRYNFRSLYEQNGRQLHAFLLYSKYEESLLGLGFAPRLIFEALRLRNGIAWMELQLAQPGGFHWLDALSPQTLNRKQVSNTLWTRWQAPKIDALLRPIHTASPLERAYYFRFLTFIAREHAMAKLGNQTKENSGFAAKWHDSLEEKRLAGNIYDGLRLVSPDAQTRGPITTVSLAFAAPGDNETSNFRVGDIVILYPYEAGAEPDARATMVLRASIEDIATATLRLRLRAPQADARVFVRSMAKPWAIEHDFMESSSGALYRGMHAFLSAPKERRDLLLLQRRPQTDPSRRLKGDYGPFNNLALRVKQARDLFLIIGPPGTGKTSYGMLDTVREELLEDGASVLLLSYTNRAVDEICSKLTAEGIDFIRVGSALACSPQYRDHLLAERVAHCKGRTQLQNLVQSARVFVGTTSSVQANIALLQLRRFTLAVVDEASQILEPHLIGLWSAHRGGVAAIGKWVFIGDHKQLPAVVQQQPEASQVDDAMLQEVLLTDCRLSLFERLLRKYGQDESVTFMLTRQGRMHHDIARFPNEAFYGGRLTEVPLPHQLAPLPRHCSGHDAIADLLLTRRVVFLASEMPKDAPSDKVNPVEADMIAATVAKIYQLEADRFDAAATVGVIVPYRNQIAAVRTAIDRYGIGCLHDITIDTVERFQGSQRRYIVYGFTVQRHYQLNFLTSHVFRDFDGSTVDRKLNVAMTRAEEHLIMVGHAPLLATDAIFARLMEFVRSRQGYFSIPCADYVAGRFSVPDVEDEAPRQQAAGDGL